jgi:hypothetical protein
MTTTAYDRDAVTAANFLVATIRPDTAEAAEQEKELGDRLARRGIQLVAATLDGADSAKVDPAVKSGFLRDVWEQSDVAVVWLDLGVDVDLDVTGLRAADFAAHDHGRRHDSGHSGELALATSVLWFGATAAAGELLACWAALCAEDPALTDATQLERAFTRVQERRAIRTVWLPASEAGVRGVDAMHGAALPHVGSIFDRMPHPYYIAAPAFRASSAGVYSLHALCHALRCAGYPAYIVGTEELNPIWNTRTLTQAEADAHAAAGIEPIVVYPEVMVGNPLGATTVVRYVMNVPGFFTGKRMEEGPEDMLFFYSPQFIEDRDPRDVDYLMAPTIDPRLFRPDPDQVRDKVLVYQHRFPVADIDMSLFPAGAELLTMENPLSLAELARLFQRTKVLYSYELSGTCTMAAACGVPVIYRPEGGMTQLPTTFLLGDNGAALSDEVGGLERATRTVGKAAEAIAGWEQRFWEQLAVFVRKTQRAAASRQRQ